MKKIYLSISVLLISLPAYSQQDGSLYITPSGSVGINMGSGIGIDLSGGHAGQMSVGGISAGSLRVGGMYMGSTNHTSDSDNDSNSSRAYDNHDQDRPLTPAELRAQRAQEARDAQAEAIQDREYALEKARKEAQARREEAANNARLHANWLQDRAMIDPLLSKMKTQQLQTLGQLHSGQTLKLWSTESVGKEQFIENGKLADPAQKRGCDASYYSKVEIQGFVPSKNSVVIQVKSSPNSGEYEECAVGSSFLIPKNDLIAITTQPPPSHTSTQNQAAPAQSRPWYNGIEDMWKKLNSENRADPRVNDSGEKIEADLIAPSSGTTSSQAGIVN